MAAGESSPEVDALDIAIAHWHVRSWGGAEYLVTRLAEALGHQEVYTMGEPVPLEPNPYGDVEFVDVRGDLEFPWLRGLFHLGGRAAEYALWADVDWRDYGDPDVLLTSGATTRAVITPEDALHVNYCHSPPRWLYDRYHDRKRSVLGRVARPAVRRLRLRDQAIDTRVDHYLANSPVVARRIWKFYKRESSVVYPPVALEDYENQGNEGFFLHLGRLDREKGVPELVEAFEGLDERLVLAGGRGDIDDGLMGRIEEAENVEYRGFVDDEEKRRLLATCSALVFNGIAEDFGIVPIEANASGKPVLTRDEGFPGFMVEPGRNGLLHDGSPAAIREAVDAWADHDWEGSDIVEGAEPYSVSQFEATLASELTTAYRSFKNRAIAEPSGNR